MARKKKLTKNTVISIRVSDEERNFLQEIMKDSHCKNMSTLMREAFRLVCAPSRPLDTAFANGHKQGTSHENAQYCSN
jgi:hypothetical protein